MAYTHRKVLVIDDNEIDRYVAKLVMENYDFAEKVICLETPMEALELLKEHEANPDELPDLIFLDINMPIMSGFDFLNEYQNLSETIQKHCIIMMLTTSLNDDDRERAKENKFVYSFLNKPLDKEKLEKIADQL